MRWEGNKKELRWRKEGDKKEAKRKLNKMRRECELRRRQEGDTSLGIQKVDTTSVGQTTFWLDKIRIRK